MDEKKKARAHEAQAAKEIDEEATFKPVTIDYAGRQMLTSGDKCLDLYSRVNRGQYAKKNIEERDAEFDNAKEDCRFMPQINPNGSYLAKPDQTLDQIKGVKEKIDMLAKGREQQEKVRATQARNPGDGLKNKKGKKAKKEPQMLGPAVISTSIEKSRFKSAFGKLEPVSVKRLQPKAQRRGVEARKLVSFFDS